MMMMMMMMIMMIMMMQFFLKIHGGMANNVDPDQTAPSGTV